MTYFITSLVLACSMCSSSVVSFNFPILVLVCLLNRFPVFWLCIFVCLLLFLYSVNILFYVSNSIISCNSFNFRYKSHFFSYDFAFVAFSQCLTFTAFIAGLTIFWYACVFLFLWVFLWWEIGSPHLENKNMIFYQENACVG